MKIIKNVPDFITDEDELVNFIYDVSFPKWVYDEIPKLESEFLVNRWTILGLIAYELKPYVYEYDNDFVK